MGSYGHDLFGAQLRGYARRTREHIMQALDNAHGWSDPHWKDAPTRGWRLALGELLTEARRRGVTEEDITKALDREKERPGTFGDPGKSRDRRIERDDQPYTEDPSRGIELAELKEYLEEIRNPEELRGMVLAERSLRLSAQMEAGID